MEIIFRICKTVFLTCSFAGTFMVSSPCFCQTTKNLQPDQLYFIENKGQWDKDVLFMARLNGLHAWITKDGVVYDYFTIVKNYDLKDLEQIPRFEQQEFEALNSKVNGHVVKLNYAKSNFRITIQPIDKQETYYNFFTGNNPEKWVGNVPLYKEIIIKDLYPGIDLRYYFDKELIRYDYIVAPGADLSVIEIIVSGSKKTGVTEDGALQISTSLGLVTHGELYAFESNEKKKRLDCRFAQLDKNKFTIKISGYDRSKQLIIDPLVYSTYIGGSSDDRAYAVDFTSKGETFIAGRTLSTNYPTTSGAYTTVYKGDAIFVSKLNARATALLYSTFISGATNDMTFCYGIQVDSSDAAFITGYTYSANYPTTNGCYDNSLAGLKDVFVTKLNASGSALVYSTFIGGSEKDQANSIAIDPSGNAYITGYTQSSNYPVTSGAFDITKGASTAVFVTKLNHLGNALVFSTFIDGGSGNQIKLDEKGYSYIAGTAYDNSFPATTGAFDVSFNGSGFDTDGFALKLDSNGSSLLFATYLGGSVYDEAFAIAMDTSYNVYVTGFTQSGAFPVTTGALQSTLGGNSDEFVLKLNSTGSSLYYSTFLGGSDWDKAYGIALNTKGYAIVSGNSASSNFPTSSGAYDQSSNGSYDLVFSEINNTGTALVYSTFIGGTSEDMLCAMDADQSGNPIMTGYTKSSNYPTTSGSYDISQNGDFDNYITYFYSVLEQATYLSFSNITSTSARCQWKKGNGNKRVVFLKAGNTGTIIPANNITYTANSEFGKGSVLGSGWYCVYNDSGSVVSITGLQPYTTYRAMVFEYIGSVGIEKYMTASSTDNPANFATVNSRPDIQASGISFTDLTGHSLTVTYTKGNGSRRIIFVKKGVYSDVVPADSAVYSPNSIFGIGSELGSSGWYCVSDNNTTSAGISGLSPNNTYFVRIFEYNGGTNNKLFNTDSVVLNPAPQFIDFMVPDTQAHHLVVSNLSSKSATLSWENGSGTARIVFVKDTSETLPLPLHNHSYLDHSDFKSGDQIGLSGWYCVYKGTDTVVDISNLSPNSVYRAMVLEYNGIPGLEKYNPDTANYNPLNFKTSYAAPDIQATEITFSDISSNSCTVKWKNGNGSKRAIFLRRTSSGTASPIENISYIADTSYSLGSQIGNTGWFCVFNGTDSFVRIGGLSANEIYRAMVCEYNGINGNEVYNIGSNPTNPANVSVLETVPDIQASGISFSRIYPSSCIISWTKGNGTKRLVFVHEGDSANPLPVDQLTYSPDTVFGHGSSVAGSTWYCVCNGNGNSVHVSGLKYQQSYKVMVLEYNGSPGFEHYNLNTAAGNPASFTTQFDQPELCYVGVDTVSNKNKICWRKPLPKYPVEGFNIYKEISSGVYTKIGNAAYDDAAVFIDTASSPGIKADTYKIAFVDQNTVESEKSYYHENISLGISKSGADILLTWNSYVDESGSFQPSVYYILKGTSPSSMLLYDSVPAGICAYTDSNISTLNYYSVAVVKTGPCSDYNRGSDQITIFSNRVDNSAFISVQEYDLHPEVLIFPNPFSDVTTIVIDEKIAAQGFSYMLYDITGKVILQHHNQFLKEIRISKGDLPEGVYFIEIKGIINLKDKLIILD